MSRPKISIMIPTYNQELYIRKSIESALSLNYENLEVILSDDCSTDNTYSIAKEYEKDSRFKAFKNDTNIGRVKNYKHTLNNLVSGDWVLNCDGDDYLINTDFFSNSMDIAATNPEIVIFSSNRYRLNENSSKLTLQKSYGEQGILNGTDLFLNYFKYDHGLFHITSLYKRDNAIKANFYSTDIISSDIDSLLRIIINKNVYHFNDIIAVWRDHDSNVSKSVDAVKRATNLILIEEVYKYHVKNESLDIKKLDKWKKYSYKNRIIRTSNRYLSKYQYNLFFRFLKEVKKSNNISVIPAILNYRLVLTFLFPYRLILTKALIKLLRSKN